MEQELQRIRREYHGLYRTYGDQPRSTAYLTAGSFDSELVLLRAALGDVVNQRVLDVGCGPGILTRDLARANTVVGIDLVCGFLERAQERGLRTALGSAAQMPFAGATFDLAVLSGIVPCADDLEPLIRDASRVIRPGGRIYLSNLNTKSIVRRLFWLVYREKHPIALHDLGVLLGLLKSHDFSGIEVFYNFYPYRAVRRLERSRFSDLAATGYAIVGRLG